MKIACLSGTGSSESRICIVRTEERGHPGDMLAEAGGGQGAGPLWTLLEPLVSDVGPFP